MIRQLGFNEVERISDSALKFIEQTGYPYGFDLDYFLSYMSKLMELGVVKIWVEFLNEDDYQARSAIGFAIGPDMFKEYGIMIELFFYGEKAGGIKVIKAAENFATREGIKQIVMASSLYNEERNGKLYERLGYTRDSSTYRKLV